MAFLFFAMAVAVVGGFVVLIVLFRRSTTEQQISNAFAEFKARARTRR